MKKVVRIFAIAFAVIFFSAAVSSCASTEDCSAYGEVKKYQQEVRK
jgi:hypothetical protein